MRQNPVTVKSRPLNGFMIGTPHGEECHQGISYSNFATVPIIQGLQREPPRVSRRPNFLREYPNEKYLLT